MTLDRRHTRHMSQESDRQPRQVSSGAWCLTGDIRELDWPDDLKYLLIAIQDVARQRAKRWISRAADLDDVSQEVAFRIWRDRETKSFRTTNDVLKYTLRTTKFVMCELYRESCKWPSLTLPEMGLPVQTNHLIEDVRRLAEEIPNDNWKRAIKLRLESFGFSEIAKQMNVATTTAFNYVHQAEEWLGRRIS